MTNDNQNKKENQEVFSEKIETKSKKKIKARKEGSEIAFGLGAFGIVGWSIAIRTIALTFLELYSDWISATELSWTITMMFAGIIIGCLNAWYWIKEKSQNK